MRPSRPHRRAAFSALELIIAIALVAVLAVILYSGQQMLSAKAKGSKCVSNLRQLGAATLLYVNEHRGFYPVGLETDLNTQQQLWYGPNAGTWFWNLAPYLHVERWTSRSDQLGPDVGTLRGPVVFTCPAHSTQESWPIVYPTPRPVSYAPSTVSVPAQPNRFGDGFAIQQLHRDHIKNFSSKIWLADSATPDIQNVSHYRWQRETPWHDAWPRQAFERHGGSGNALFFDGHVETIPCATMAAKTQDELYQLFSPWY